ncbi:MAG TPA: ATP-binding cassette domain-containing protein [Cellulomonas sp.]
MNARTVTRAGLVAAAATELCSVGLLAASGWFITASAIAGLSVASTFSYILPSAWVRAFATGRIAFQYGQRMLLHRSALSEVSAARDAYFTRVAANGATAGQRDGALLDRAVHDADAVGMRLITVRAPLLSFVVAVIAGGCFTLVLAPVAAVCVLAFGAVALVLARRLERRRALDEAAGDLRRSRERSALIELQTAWPELVSLGAAPGLLRTELAALDGYTAARRRRADGPARAALAVSALGVAATALATAVSVLVDQVSPPDTILVLLMMVGLSTSALVVPTALMQRRLTAEAEHRLEEIGRDAPDRPRPGLVARLDGDRLDLARYELPATVTHGAATLAAHAARSEALVVTGPSGCGKTTLLDALSAELETQRPGQGAVLEVPVDDYLFTGTVAENLRLGDPEASDRTLRTLLDDLGLRTVPLATPIGVGGRALSGGEQTRLRIARGLLAAPEVLLIDEPLAGLDQDSRTRVLTAVRARSQDRVVVLAVHDAAPVVEVYGAAARTLSLAGGAGAGAAVAGAGMQVRP